MSGVTHANTILLLSDFFVLISLCSQLALVKCLMSESSLTVQQITGEMNFSLPGLQSDIITPLYCNVCRGASVTWVSHQFCHAKQCLGSKVCDTKNKICLLVHHSRSVLRETGCCWSFTSKSIRLQI